MKKIMSIAAIVAITSAAHGAIDMKFEKIETTLDLFKLGAGALELGDVDGDGLPDVFRTGYDDLACGGPQGCEFKAALFLNRGGGNFVPTLTKLKGSSQGEAKFADLDEDGKTDLIYTGTKGTFLYLGDGRGDFKEAVNPFTNVEGRCLTLADLNEDGRPDLVLAGGGQPVRLFRNLGQGRFEAMYENKTFPFFYCGIAAGDFRQNGKKQVLIVGGLHLPANDKREVEQSYALALEVGGDSVKETTLPGIVPLGIPSLSIGDLDRDGKNDLVMIGTRIADDGAYDPETQVFHNLGDGHFELLPKTLPEFYHGNIELCDLDEDGVLDVVAAGDVRDYPARAGAFRGGGHGGFDAFETDLRAEWGWARATCVDLDGDGHKDIVTYSNTQLHQSGRNFIEVYLQRSAQRP